MTFKDIIFNGCKAFGLDVTDEQLDRLERFSDLLVAANRDFNLTTVTEPEQIATRHMLDCLFLLTCASFQGARAIDIGCGAGFPTVPLLCCGATDITALDSTGKRVEFVQRCCDTLGLPVTAVTARAEDYIAAPRVRERFDIAMSRAVAPLNILSELCLPYVAPGGVFLAMKSCGEQAEDEITAAHTAFQALGASLEARREYELDGIRRQVLIIRKTSPGDSSYPRRYSKIKQRPL